MKELSGGNARRAVPSWSIPREIWLMLRTLSHGLERIELLNDHRDELLLQCAQSRRLLESFLCRTWLVEGDVASFQPFAAARAQGKAYNEAARGQKKHQMGQPFMSVFAAFVNGLTTEALGSTATGLEEVEMAWLHEFRKKLTSALDVGRFLEMWNIRETTRKEDQYALWYETGCAHQIPLSKHHQTGTHSTQSSSAPQAGRPSTADEQRAKNSESTRAAPQESGGQIRSGDEIDIYETDLAESLAMWGLGEEDEVFQ